MKLTFKVFTYLLIIMFACENVLEAQTRMSRNNAGTQNNTTSNTQSGDSLREDPCVPINDARRCWTIDPMTGIIYSSQPDTSYLGLGNKQSMESKALALVHTGNLYSPHQVQAFLDRRKNHDFIFANAYNLFRVDPSQIQFYNSKLPCTVLSYSKEGGGLQTNDHLKINFFGNFNKQIGIGTNLDYVYARGEYVQSSTKPLKWNSYAYYEGDQYKAYLTFTVGKYANQENGGIADRSYILNPDNHPSQLTDPKNMLTNLVNTWNSTDHRQVHFQHNYSIGRWEEKESKDDSTYQEFFVPIASAFHSIDLDYMHHTNIMNDGAILSDKKLYENDYYGASKGLTHDSTTFSDLTTYAGLRLNEGFNRFSQFSISAFVGYERLYYLMSSDTLGYPNRHHSSNSIWVGGQLSRHLSSALTIDATARFALLGDRKNDIDIHGNAQTVIPFGRINPETGSRSDSIIIQAGAMFNNQNVSYLTNHYFSRYYRWDEDFESEQHSRIEGRISYPSTHTSIRIGNEVINNYHYYNSLGLPAQYHKGINITAIEARQSLWAGKWLQWENALLFQYSTEDSIIALPKFSIETDLSLHFKIARTLAIQAGIAGYYYTKYYAPNYQPNTQQFYTQQEFKCGGYPILNAYVNCNLKRIKFFLTVHNMLENVKNDMFIMPYYPHQSRRIEYGLILDLQN